MQKLLFLFSIFILVNCLFAQDSETREGIGLPVKAGENATNTQKGNLSGKITLIGLDTSKPKPNVAVAVYFNGVFLDRSQVNDEGFYLVRNVPRDNVAVVVEVGGIEVGRQQLLPSSMGSIRQDFTINLGQNVRSQTKADVVSAEFTYQRSDENEKLFQKAATEVKDKKIDEAISALKQIVFSDKKDFIAWTELGTLLFQKENFADAEKCYIAALSQKITFMPALINLGRLYLAQKSLENAINVLTKAVLTKPDSADANHLLGEAYLQAKKGSKAVVYLNQALKLAPIEKAEIHLRLATLYNAAGMKDKAVEEYKQFLQKVPQYPDKEKIEKYIKENSPK